MTCAHCAERARELNDLRDEVAAWRAQEADTEREREAAEAFALWRSVVPARPAVVRTLMLMADASPRAVSIERLTEVSRSGAVGVIKVNISQAREALREIGVTASIECLSGYGYRLDAAGASALWARLEEADR